MKKFFRYFSFLISHLSSQKGFTLIEMILVFALVGTLTAAGLSAFFSYSRNQNYKTAVSDVVHELNFLRSRAIAQAKPSQCGTAPLNGFEFWYPTDGTYYRVRVMCGGVYHNLVAQKNLPPEVTFGTSTTTFFKVATGTVDGVKNIMLTGDGKTTTINVSTTGVVSVQ